MTTSDLENTKTKEEQIQMKQVQETLICLLRYAVGDNGFLTLPDMVDLEAVYNLAKKHSLLHLAAYGLEKLMLPDSEITRKFQAAKMQAIYHHVRMDYEYEQICRILETAQIPFIPLKGAVIRQYYPEPWMRNSCDIDILVKEESLLAAETVLQSHGWLRRGEKTFHDVSLFSASGVHLELHFSIVEQFACIDYVLNQCWEYACPVEGKQYEYRFTKEFLLYHQLAHMSYHFVYGGCGVRSFLDLWILKNRCCWDEDILRDLCKKAGLESYYDACMSLTEIWFQNGDHNALTLQMEQYVFHGGMYGKISNRVLLDQAKAGGYWKNLIKRVFFPYHRMIIKYPVLVKHKWLMPLFYLVRWGQLITKKRWKRTLRELASHQDNSKEDILKARDLLQYLGLNEIR